MRNKQINKQTNRQTTLFYHLLLTPVNSLTPWNQETLHCKVCNLSRRKVVDTGPRVSLTFTAWVIGYIWIYLKGNWCKNQADDIWWILQVT